MASRRGHRLAPPSPGRLPGAGPGLAGRAASPRWHDGVTSTRSSAASVSPASTLARSPGVAAGRDRRRSPSPGPSRSPAARTRGEQLRRPRAPRDSPPVISSAVRSSHPARRRPASCCLGPARTPRSAYEDAHRTSACSCRPCAARASVGHPAAEPRWRARTSPRPSSSSVSTRRAVHVEQHRPQRSVWPAPRSGAGPDRSHPTTDRTAGRPAPVGSAGLSGWCRALSAPRGIPWSPTLVASVLPVSCPSAGAPSACRGSHTAVSQSQLLPVPGVDVDPVDAGEHPPAARARTRPA